VDNTGTTQHSTLCDPSTKFKVWSCNSFLFFPFNHFNNSNTIMRQRRSTRVDLSSDLMGVDSTSIQESFLMQETRQRIEDILLPKQRRPNDNKVVCNGYSDNESSDHDCDFMLHCTTPVSCASTITMDFMSTYSNDDSSLPSLPGLDTIPTDQATMGIIDGIKTATAVALTPKNRKRPPTVFVDEDSFTYITFEESKSSHSSCNAFNGLSSDAVNGTTVAANGAMQTPYSPRISIGDAKFAATNTAPKATLQTPHIYNTPQSPYTYETIESVANMTGIRTQYTFETVETLDKENSPNRTYTTSKRGGATKIYSAQSPLEGRKIYDASPLPNSIPCTPQKKKEDLYDIDLDSFSIDQYISSPDHSSDCFSIDSYASWDDGLGFGGAGITMLDLARARRDQSMYRLRSIGGRKLHSLRKGPSTPSPQNSCGGINQRREQMEVQRRRLSQAVQSYCQSIES